jgi:hypothetical protein
VRPSRPATRTSAARSPSSLTLSALWTGGAAAAAGVLAGMITVAISWLPVSGPAGNSSSVLHAGLLTFLASLHGGVTVNGTAAAFLPLGLLLATGFLTWRAGAALADAASAAGEYRTRPLVRAAVVQAASFAACCLIAAWFADLGTSSVYSVKVVVAALLVFALSGGVALVRSSPLRAEVAARVPAWLPGAARDATAVLAAYAMSGALLVAGSLALHADRVRLLFTEIGGGWGSVPVLFLDLLAAPNAVIAAISYLLGPGFAAGAHTVADPMSGAAGPVPAFPLLGALPDGPASPFAWVLIALAPVVAVATVIKRVTRIPGTTARLVAVARAAGVVAVAGFVLAWQAGGGIGGGHLATVGPSPWLTGLAFGVEVLVAAAAGLGLQAAVQQLRGRSRGLGTARLRGIVRRSGDDLVRSETTEDGPDPGSAEAPEDELGPIAEQPTEPIRTGRLAG